MVDESKNGKTKIKDLTDNKSKNISAKYPIKRFSTFPWCHNLEYDMPIQFDQNEPYEGHEHKVYHIYPYSY